MRTEAQINASRINGAKSRGPVTPEGKQISSRNAETHGLLANTLVLKGESRDSFFELVAELLEEHRPQTPTEYALVQMMIAARWRQMRIWGMETAGLDHEIDRQAAQCSTAEYNATDNVTRAAKAFRTLGDDSRSLDLYSRYDARYERQFQRALRSLQNLVDRRLSLTPVPTSDAETVTPTAVMPDAAASPASGLPQAAADSVETMPDSPSEADYLQADHARNNESAKRTQRDFEIGDSRPCGPVFRGTPADL
jgi:hypothetical protein